MATRKKKKFGQTTVGKILKGAVSLINPTLGAVLQGATTVEDAIAGIADAKGVTAEDKLRAKELVLEAYEAEIADRISARNREAVIASAGGSDILFKSIGWSISLAFLAVVAFGLGILPQDENINKDFLMFASGSVTSAFMAVVSYYFGSSMGSKQKQNLLNQN